MDIDAYQQCPCHSDKKIKFCCGKEIVTDLNQILAKNSAGQGLAALDDIDRVMAKTGPKDCMLTIQTHILLAHGEIEKAKASNELFMEKNPKHSTGLQHRALIRLAEGDIAGSVDSLQDAMDAIPGNEIPVSFAQAFRVVGLGMLQAGHLIGARTHLMFALYLKNDSDPELSQMVFETFRMPDAPMLLKQELSLLPLAESDSESDWGKKYANVQRALDRGQFRKALKYLKKIDASFPEHPEIAHGIATINLQLGYIEDIPAAWRQYSRMEGISELAAVEAEAIAQLFRTAGTEESGDSEADIAIVRTTIELNDFSAALEAVLSNPRLVSETAVAEDPFEEGPAPRNVFLLLDRKQCSLDELNSSTVSTVSSEFLMYGKQTDRPARVEWVAVQSDSFVADKQFVEGLFSAWADGNSVEASLGKIPPASEALTWNWHLPKGVTHQQHSELVKEKYRKVLSEKWSHLRFPELDNKTPVEAAKIPELTIALHGLLIVLEQTTQAQVDLGVAVGTLRTELGVAPLSKIELGSIRGRKPTMLERMYVNLENATDGELLELQTDAMAVGDRSMVRNLAQEVLNRPELENPTRDVTYALLAQLTDDTEEGLGYLAHARSEAKKLDKPIGVYLVQEFEFRLARGMTEKLPELLQTIQLHHLKDPDVEHHLSRVLERFGLLQGPEGGPQAGGGMEPAASAPPSNLLGADGGSLGGGARPADARGAPADQTPTEEPSKLWTPD